MKNIIIEDQSKILEVQVTSVQTEAVVDIFINEFAGLETEVLIGHEPDMGVWKIIIFLMLSV